MIKLATLALSTYTSDALLDKLHRHPNTFFFSSKTGNGKGFSLSKGRNQSWPSPVRFLTGNTYSISRFMYNKNNIPALRKRKAFSKASFA